VSGRGDDLHVLQAERLHVTGKPFGAGNNVTLTGRVGADAGNAEKIEQLREETFSIRVKVRESRSHSVRCYFM
jgi:hypothetical protein